MAFVEMYRQQVLEAIDAIDLQLVEQAIEWFREARAQGHIRAGPMAGARHDLSGAICF